MIGNRRPDLDSILQKLALEDFEQFCGVTGLDLSQGYVCLELRKKSRSGKGKSVRAISQALGLSKKQVEIRIKKCPEFERRTGLLKQ
jgi:hypothetical protein